MLDRAFIDTNIIVYLFSADEPDKRIIATDVFNCYSEPVVSIAVLNELCNVMLKKFSIPSINMQNVVHELSRAAIIVNGTTNTIRRAIDIHEKLGFSYFDSFHLATAAENGCPVFFSEDMQHGQKIGTVKIINPFQT